MEKFELIVPTLFGLESFTAREIKNMGYETIKVDNGKVVFLADEYGICRSNIKIRTGERVLIKIGEFKALSFDDLFEGTKALDWSRWIGKKDKFPVKGSCLKSTLASERDCQSIIKKAVAVSLSDKYGVDILPEEDDEYQIQFSIYKDIVTLMIDTSGQPLHKRGYRTQSNIAPLRETIAAGMIMLSYWKYEYPLADPFCGSGTIPIEAAMIKKNIAPGINRNFAAEKFSFIDKKLWNMARDEAQSEIRDIELNISASDINSKTLQIAKANAKRAGVDKYISFKELNACDFSSNQSYGSIICNPPYGERMSQKSECEKLYTQIGKTFRCLDKWSYYVLTSHENFEKLFGKKSNKKRKIYNGMIKCNLYQYFGERPPKIK